MSLDAPGISNTNGHNLHISNVRNNDDENKLMDDPDNSDVGVRLLSDAEDSEQRSNGHGRMGDNDEEENEDGGNNGFSDGSSPSGSSSSSLWQPTGNVWKDAWYFVGPGFMVSIAYIDPGNYQADIQAGATTRYYLLFFIFWASILSIYIQVLCVRLAYYSQMNLAEVQAREAKLSSDADRDTATLTSSSSSSSSYLINPFGKVARYYWRWLIAEVSVVITDLPEVIGIGIACHHFFGWPYYVGVLLSLLTTMLFLATMNFGIRTLESIIVVFVGMMSIALFIEMAVVKPDTKELIVGWTYGFTEVQSDDLFVIAGILGAVVMPHNLYLHTAIVQNNRKVQRRPSVIRQAVKYSSIEPILPIVVSFFVNMAVVAIAAESVYGTDDAEDVGLTDFCSYFQSLKGGCVLWGIALLAAGQSSAITTTYTGQYVMDGFLNLKIPIRVRAIVTRLIAITPCAIVSALFPEKLNQLVNIVNAWLGFLLPFALTPLVRYNCSEQVMGRHHAATGIEKIFMYLFAIMVWAVSALALSWKGGGFFGDYLAKMEAKVDDTTTTWQTKKHLVILLQIIVQLVYAWWNFTMLFTPVSSTFYLPTETNDDEDDNDNDNTAAEGVTSTNGIEGDDDDDDDDENNHHHHQFSFHQQRQQHEQKPPPPQEAFEHSLL